MNRQQEEIDISRGIDDGSQATRIYPEQGSRMWRHDHQSGSSSPRDATTMKKEEQKIIPPTCHLFPSIIEVESIHLDKLNAERTELTLRGANPVPFPPRRVSTSSSSSSSWARTRDDHHDNDDTSNYQRNSPTSPRVCKADEYDSFYYDLDKSEHGAPLTTTEHYPETEYHERLTTTTDHFPKADYLERLVDDEVADPSLSQKTSSSCHNRKMIEVSPGLELPLLGANETLDALYRGEIACTTCSICPIDRLYCYDEAAYVLCPVCMVISPVFDVEPSEPGRLLLRESGAADEKIKARRHDGPTTETGIEQSSSCEAVGLGMTEPDFFAYHYERAQQAGSTSK